MNRNVPTVNGAAAASRFPDRRDLIEYRNQRIFFGIMRVRIDREREERRITTGWFARAAIAAYPLSLTVHLSEEERFLLRQSGIGHYVFFRSPIPPDITDPETVRTMKAADHGLLLVRDLLGMGRKTLIGVWPDLIAADEAEAVIRLKLEELAGQIGRAGETTENTVVYEP